MTSHSDNAPKNGAILLKSMMPRAGFDWPNYSHVTTRRELDFKIQDAMRTHGGADFRFQRKQVVDLLV